jgi:hypothetical protein
MTMGKKRKMMIGAAVVVVVCLSGVGVWKTGVFKNKDTSCGSYPISPPGPVMNATKTDGNYTINIKYILSHYSNNPYQLTSDDILWLNISKVWFVLGEEEGPGCPQFKTIEGIINGSINENNTTHGKLMDILNNASSNITYYDNDDDGILSVNDTFIVKSNAIPNNAQYMYLFLVYNGACPPTYRFEIIIGLNVIWWEVEV